MTEPTKKKTAAELLKEALAVKKAGAGKGAQKLRADKGNSKPNKDAERLRGQSRQVH